MNTIAALSAWESRGQNCANTIIGTKMENSFPVLRLRLKKPASGNPFFLGCSFHAIHKSSLERRLNLFPQDAAIGHKLYLDPLLALVARDDTGMGGRGTFLKAGFASA